MFALLVLEAVRSGDLPTPHRLVSGRNRDRIHRGTATKGEGLLSEGAVRLVHSYSMIKYFVLDVLSS